MGGYDLYGNYYPNINDALNAEMSQCNEIDNRFNQNKNKRTWKKIAWTTNFFLNKNDINKELYHLLSKIEELEERILNLEKNKNDMKIENIFKIGDNVFDFRYGWGVIDQISECFSDTYSIIKDIIIW